MTKPIVKGPVDGNAFAIIGVVRRAMLSAREPMERIEEATRRMTAGDYDNLLAVGTSSSTSERG